MKNLITNSQKSEAYKKEAAFDFDNNIVLHYYPNRIIDILNSKNFLNISMLELGLGHGYTAEVFSQHFSDYSIVEGDSEVIDQFTATHTISNTTIIHSFFEDYCCKRKYDVIVMGFVLEHVENPLAILKQYSKLLDKEGRIFITVPNAESMHRRLGYIAGDLKDLYLLSEADNSLGHRRYFTKDSLIALIEESGLVTDRIEGLFLKPLSTRQMISLNLEKKYIDALLELSISYPELSSCLMAECHNQTTL